MKTCTMEELKALVQDTTYDDLCAMVPELAYGSLNQNPTGNPNLSFFKRTDDAFYVTVNLGLVNLAEVAQEDAMLLTRLCVASSMVLQNVFGTHEYGERALHLQHGLTAGSLRYEPDSLFKLKLTTDDDVTVICGESEEQAAKWLTECGDLKSLFEGDVTCFLDVCSISGTVMIPFVIQKALMFNLPEEHERYFGEKS